MDEVFIGPRSVLFVFLVLEVQHWESSLPRAEPDGVGHTLVALLPDVIVSPHLPGSVGGGVNDAGGAGAESPGVICPDAAGAVVGRTVLVVDPSLREVSKSVFGISQLAEGEGESWHGKLPVEMVVSGGADPAEHVCAVGASVPEGGHAAVQAVNDVVGPVGMDILR